MLASIRKKLVIVGDAACGKTCLLSVFSKDKFFELYAPTVFESYTSKIKVDDKLIDLVLWDNAGNEYYDRLRPLSYAATDVFLMCFSIESINSLSNIKEIWYPEVKHFCPDVPIILVGIKKDLRDDENARKELLNLGQEPIKPEYGQAMAEKIQARAYLECSAKTKEGLNLVFETAARASLELTKKKKNGCNLI